MRRLLRRLIPLTIATFAVGTNGNVIAGILPGVATSLGISESRAGLLLTLFALTYALCAPLVGALIGNADRRTVLLAGLGVFIAGNVVFALAGSFSVALAGRIVTAAGAATVVSVAMATATALAPPHRRGRALALVVSGFTIATTLGVPLGALLGGTNWRLPIWGIAVLGAVAAVGIAIALPQVELPTTGLTERLRPLADPRVLWILLVSLLLLTSGYVMYTYIGPVTTAATGGDARLLTLILLSYGIGSVVGNMVAGFLTDRFPAVRVLIVGMIVLSLTMAVTPWAVAGVATALIWALVWGTSGWLNGLPQQHRLVALAPQSAVILLGLSTSAMQFGVAIGSGIGGALLPSGIVVQAGAAMALVLAALVVTVATRRLTAPRDDAA